jgi:exoribonuclease-2
MNVFYEEDGDFKAATVLEDNSSSLQVQTQHGKRAKVKSGAVLLRFDHASLGEFMDRVRSIAEGLDANFLWEVCGSQEFAFDTLAREYYGRSPKPEEAAGLLVRLHATPTHFYRKGKGHYKPAPAEALKAALAALERKRAQAELQTAYQEQLRRGVLPQAFRPMLRELLYKPDRNATELKALDATAAELKTSVPRLLERCGGLASSSDYHLGRFLFEHFPGGTGFAAGLDVEAIRDLPEAPGEAFSIDDATTTEIDDAFSVRSVPGGGFEVGIHIAAPALGIASGSALDREAARRMSTVYFPGDKITMLPEAVVDRFTLAENRRCPALSLYVTLTPELQIAGTRNAIECIAVRSNLRHDVLDERFDEQAAAERRADFEHGADLLLLHRLAQSLEARRGKSDGRTARAEYNFYVSDDRVRIVPRRRGSPLDKVVSEMMILVNSEWARQLMAADVPALYRVQSNGKVRLSTVPAAHQGLGVEQYVWASSPIRRYTDLANQRQLLALVRGLTPPYAKGDERLLMILRDFESAYEAYNEFQRQMERYWCLRWLLQEQVTVTSAVVVREELVTLERIPLFCRTASLPALPPGARVEVALSHIDLFELSVHCEYRAVLPAESADTVTARL